MNAKNSHCMSKRVFLALAMMLFATAASAQQRPYERETDRNVWLSGGNIAGLRERITENISYAEMYGRLEDGGYRHSYEAPSLWNAGVEARTIMHLDKFSMIGGFSFDQMTGQNMCGSMFIEPGYYPLDALEFTPGQKTKQTYAFDGGISVDLGRGWKFGAGLDFESANYSKRKDLRYTDYRLDMKFTSGLVWTAGDNAFGLDYIYRKNSECPDSEQIGTGVSSYYAFLDKGQHYGKYEVWTGGGVHLDQNGVKGLPLKEHYNGAGLQWAFRNMYFLDFEYLHGSGSAGERQFIWYRFPSHVFNLRLVERIEYADKTFLFKEGISGKYQKNSETVIEVISSNGVMTTTEYGSNQILERKFYSVNASWDVLRDGFDYGVFVDMDECESLASQVYPYLTNQRINVNMLGAYVTFRPGKFELGPEFRFTSGNVTESERLSSENIVPSRPYRLEEYYQLEMDYLTSRRVNFSAFLRYNMAKGIYVQADADFIKAYGLEYIDGDTRCSGVLRLGWTF